MILHIPHAGTNTLGRHIEQFDIDYLTDCRTDELFNCEFATKLVFPISRFVCDVERFPDEYEEMFKIGQGICYTKGTRDNDIEVIDKEGILKIYDKWHLDLILLINQTLCYFSKIVLVDCHSFPDKEGYPDFCIGTTEQTPKELVDSVKDFLTDYDVKINYPYSGSIIPAKFVGNPDVFPIMIEVNKKLYLNNEDDFNKIKIVINQLLGVIAEYEDSFE